jgi:hypothetical protein
VFSRPIGSAGRWAVRYSAFGEPSFCAVLEGSCRLAVEGHVPERRAGRDLVLARRVEILLRREPATAANRLP